MEYERRLRNLNILKKVFQRFTAALLMLSALYVTSSAYDMYVFTGEGLPDDGFPGFEELLRINPDVVAWIRLDGTHIDHPVLQGEDNFEYTNKDLSGEFYQGGSIFLDCGNAPDMSDDYIIIHGHHMSRGAMFSDVAEYMQEDFFKRNTTGELLTPEGNYELTVCGVKAADAYDGELYYTGNEAGRPLHLMDGCIHRRDIEFADGDKLVMLSTCSGNMTNERTVVFCRARKAVPADSGN